MFREKNTFYCRPNEDIRKMVLHPQSNLLEYYNNNHFIDGFGNIKTCTEPKNLNIRKEVLFYEGLK